MADYSYANLAEIKTEVVTTKTVADAKLLELGQFATERIDEFLKTRFAPYIATISFDEIEIECDPHGLPLLRLPKPLLSVTSFTDRDGNSLVANTDYLLLPRNQTPKTKIRLDDFAVVEPGSTFTEVASIAGIWGWRRDYSTAFTQLSTVGSDADSTTTTIAVVNGAVFSPGDFLRIDSEFIGVVSIASNNLTVVRGINGSTAAAHTSTTPVYRFAPEPGIVRACQVQAKYMQSRVGSTEATKYDPMGAVLEYPVDLSGEVVNILQQGAWNVFEMWIPYR